MVHPSALVVFKIILITNWLTYSGAMNFHSFIVSFVLNWYCLLSTIVLTSLIVQCIVDCFVGIFVQLFYPVGNWSLIIFIENDTRELLGWEPCQVVMLVPLLLPSHCACATVIAKLSCFCYCYYRAIMLNKLLYCYGGIRVFWYAYFALLLKCIFC